MSHIVAVHGVGNHTPGYSPEKIAADRGAVWAGQLAAGLGAEPAAVDLTFAYYAHQLRTGTPTAQGGADSALDHLGPDETRAIAQWVDALALPQATAQGRLAVPLRAAVDLVARRFSLDGRLTRLFVATFFREVTTYLSGPDAPVRTAAREQVASVIRAHRPSVVIAHSLGTVVTYEALHAHPDLQIDLLLTLGSPLALPHAVFHQLQPTPRDSQGIRPPGVGRWVNIADHGDPIAVLRPLKAYFPGIDLDLTESTGLFRLHGAAGYLGSAATAAAVAPYL
ncbi:hypothetical protein FRZ03_09705 [Streptomyces misionensis]|uniref:Serine peptidase n=2 Tax=Streptomyces misionensis TaxID=67331 RepID=A0A5C6JW60_9ACTN|nr:hypothetical protein FRZ03_09705 [Streptomyces misionensis]